jgi:hypothetical protein
VGTEPIDYCRHIESYLCQKNDGHLIRIAGPSFDLVSAWAARGVPLKIAFRGIDRYFERYYASKTNRPRRRPVRIDFCEADVLDVFDEWRRATGLTAAGEDRLAADGQTGHRGSSLPVHMERILRRLTSARAAGTLDAGFDDLLDRVSCEMDAAGSVRGAKRQALVERLAALDRELLDAARARLDEATLAALVREAEEELAGFRSGMSPEALARARDAALDRLVRDRAGLPTIAFY